MKKIISIIILLCMILSMTGCRIGTKTETDTLRVDGICVNDSYRDNDNSPLRLVYLFLTVKAGTTNSKIDSLNMNLFINENSYESEHIPNACKYAQNYYYSSYIKDVYTGTEQKLVATFKIPETELVKGKKITLQDEQLTDEEKLSLNTRMIQHYENMENICKAMDPRGYEESMDDRKEVSAETEKQVRSLLDGKQWMFTANSLSYSIQFDFTSFVLKTRFSNGGGPYTVLKKYITYLSDDETMTVEIPYKITDGKIDLDLIEAFDVKQN